jgi:ABC-type transport system involved in multi-copper enzyme maturation permease subunit
MWRDAGMTHQHTPPCYAFAVHAIVRWFWLLLPANPIVVRVVQGSSRRTRHLWVRMGYLGALTVLVMFGLMTGGGLAGEVSLNDLAKSGARLFATVAYGQVIFVCLLAPLFMAAALAQEQSGKTYDILLTTPMSNLQIVLGTLMGRLFLVLALLASGLPLFSVLLIFGGVPVSSVFVAFAVAGLTALMVGSVAVTLSVLRAAGRKAVFTFVIVVAAYLAMAYAVDRLLLRDGISTTWLTPLHPLLVLEASINTANYRPPDAQTLVRADGTALPRALQWYLSQPLAAFATLTGVGSVLLIAFGAIALRQVGKGESRLGWWLRKVLRLGAVGERRRPPRHVWDNPIAWREANTRGKLALGILARWGFTIAGVAAAVVLVVLHHRGTLPIPINPQTGQPNMDQAGVFRAALLTLLLGELAVIVLVAIYMSAGCVSREREDGTLDLILTTPVTPQRYIWGKLRGLVSFLTLMLCAPVLTLAVASTYATITGAQASYFIPGSSGGSTTRALLLPEAPLLLAAMLVPFVAMCVMVGMSASLKAKGVLGAVIPAVGMVGCIALLTGFCGWAAVSQIPFVGPMINALSPTTNLLMILNPWENVSGFASAPGAGRVSLVIAALAAAAGYSAVVYAMLTRMVSSFDMTVRRLTGTM